MSGGALTSLLKNMISFSCYKEEDAESVGASLNLGRVSLLTTITRLGRFVDFSVLCVTSESSEPEPQKYSSKPLNMSLTLQLPGHWEGKSLRLVGRSGSASRGRDHDD